MNRYLDVPNVGFAVTDLLDTSCSVLIVEDEAYIASEIEQMMGELGYEDVTVCLSFSRAARLIEEAEFDLGIVDINVGGMLSYRLISQAIDQGAAVLTISGFINKSEANSKRAFLGKPFDLAELRMALGEAMRLRVVASSG